MRNERAFECSIHTCDQRVVVGEIRGKWNNTHTTHIVGRNVQLNVKKEITITFYCR